ncbi:MAG TPA: flagellar hook-length control protein FliK, partial [Burkholderiaceae bacterium]|nr:flagellar hook-length control protein FliK [Burkholderiaceae bacterium]
LAGKNRFDIRLDPPELGRIEVRLEVSSDGRVTSHLTADRQDTLNLLQRDSSGLQRALQDAGLKTSDNSMQFSLRDQSAGQQQQQNSSGGNTPQLVVDDEIPIEALPSSYARLAGFGNGLDIRV